MTPPTAVAPAAGMQVRQVSWPSRTILADLHHIDDSAALLAGSVGHPTVSRG